MKLPAILNFGAYDMNPLLILVIRRTSKQENYQRQGRRNDDSQARDRSSDSYEWPTSSVVVHVKNWSRKYSEHKDEDRNSLCNNGSLNL